MHNEPTPIVLTLSQIAAPLLFDSLHAHLKSTRAGNVPPQVILECSRVDYFANTDLRQLTDLASLARSRGGDIKLAGLAPTIEQVAALMANGDPLECHPDVASARAAFQSPTVTAGT